MLLIIPPLFLILIINKSLFLYFIGGGVQLAPERRSACCPKAAPGCPQGKSLAKRKHSPLKYDPAPPKLEIGRAHV